MGTTEPQKISRYETKFRLLACGSLHLAAFLSSSAFVTDSHAQTVKLREPTRVVYKCEKQGNVIYTDEPCLGAKQVDVEPTRGLNASTGRELTGADVRRERQNEMFADAVRPITGKDAMEIEVQKRRFKLQPGARAECATLDRRIIHLEAQERMAAVDERTDMQPELFTFRKRHRELGC
ncbi:MAG: hypothetical protein H0W40_11620 [Methylibium sp.]|uniref:hypothetical protein n=1 Tax=Methylibium sp. TaxID=2067992 RepID=UPI0017EB788D|nr:hypothetical protein [Methylibium sp.]MBA3598006.1 hypothetical protein [Methylibium sp.]